MGLIAKRERKVIIRTRGVTHVCFNAYLFHCWKSVFAFRRFENFLRSLSFCPCCQPSAIPIVEVAHFRCPGRRRSNIQRSQSWAACIPSSDLSTESARPSSISWFLCCLVSYERSKLVCCGEQRECLRGRHLCVLNPGLRRERQF